MSERSVLSRVRSRWPIVGSLGATPVANARSVALGVLSVAQPNIGGL